MKQHPLSKSEEELMNALWAQGRAKMTALLESYPDPKPAPTTVATLLKRMRDKGFIDYESVGRAREYFPLVRKKEYFSNHLKNLIHNFFNGSPSQFASFFTQETNLDREELEELRRIIDREIDTK